MTASAFVAAAAAAQVPYDRLLKAEGEPANWLTYSGGYGGQRFSALTEITPANVARLKPIWLFQSRATSRFETSPLVADGILYLTEPQDGSARVRALDAATGRVLWTWQRPLPKEMLNIGFPRANRGPALLDGMLYVGTVDAHLVALDARSGALRWDVTVADNKTGHSLTVAPLALDDKVIVGTSGGEAGIRGFLDAYDAKTGARLWRLWTIPAKGEPHNDSWGGDSWKTGGAPTWVTGSYDPELKLLYWGTGNPAPDWNGDARPGDNLYSCSLLAVDPDKGTLRWHFQFTPHDTHDWDSNHVPVLIDAPYQGRPRKLVAVANRNAFFYLLDRATGEFLLGAPYVKQTWADGLDAKGRPIARPGMEPSVEGTLVWPSLNGATVWFSPAYSPRTGLFYVGAREKSSYYFKSESKYEPGKPFMGGGERDAPQDEQSGALRALDPLTGKLRWEFPLHTPSWSGVLATAGGLVFSGSVEGNFYALDAATGKPLWEFQTGGEIAANPIAFAAGGKQRVAIAAGRALIVFGLE
jgi:alcohol dehydrogenase (cytochrome c)